MRLRSVGCGALAGVLACLGSAVAQPAAALPLAPRPARPALSFSLGRGWQGGSAPFLLVISGLGGDPQHSEMFYRWGKAIMDAARTRYQLPVDHTIFLAEDVARDSSLITGRSTREEVEKRLADIAHRTGPGDEVLIVYIGHGSYRSGESRINLPGPDLTAKDLSALLARFTTQKVAFVNTANASGEFVAALSGKNRVIITATKSGMEGNDALFGQYFAQALASDDADTDKDGRTSLLEAFVYARREVARDYEQGNRLLTEHAVLDDDGNGKGSDEPDPAHGDGALARTFAFGAVTDAARAVAPPGASPELRALYEEKGRLEQRIAALKGRKDAMDPTEYEQQLEKLLVDLALNTQAIRKLEGKS